MQSRILFIAAVVASAAIFSSTFAGPAHATSKSRSTDEVSAALGAISNVDPELLAKAASVSTESNGDLAIDSSVADVAVAIPIDPEVGVSLTGSRGNKITIGFPFEDKAADATPAKKGVVVYDNKNGYLTIPVVRTDGTLPINTVIQSPAAPQAYS